MERAQSHSIGSAAPVTVGSVQSMQNGRLEAFPGDYFSTIVVDEAHHCLADSYTNILHHFANANVLGMTATADRADKRSLMEYFDSVAYEYTLERAINEGYLAPITIKRINLSIDLGNAKMQNGDFVASDVANAVEPYLWKIAEIMMTVCAGRRTVVFTPLIHTSELFVKILREYGFRAEEVNGNSPDRKEKLQAFARGEFDVCVNSMLLTEGWDCPCVDCVMVLRPTRVRSLLAQMIGRGTRLYPGKKDLLFPDFLWLSEKYDVCSPVSLLCVDERCAKAMEKRLMDGEEHDLLETKEEMVEEIEKQDAVEARERALAEELAKHAHRSARGKLVGSLAYLRAIEANDLLSMHASEAERAVPVSLINADMLADMGIDPESVICDSLAEVLLKRLEERKRCNFASPKQIALLARKGYRELKYWHSWDARRVIGILSKNNWNPTHEIDPAMYLPERSNGCINWEDAIDG